MEELLMDCGCKFKVIGPPRYKGGPPLIDFNPMNRDDINWDCPKVWELFASGRTLGVFQLEKRLGQVWSKKLKPESLDHIAALTALLRPGCLKAKDDNGVSMTQHYVLRKNGEEEAIPFDESIADILKDNYQTNVYQEETILIARKVAGFNLVEADILRKAIGSKDAAKMSKVKTMFLEKAKEVGLLSDEKAAQLFDYIEKSARFSFNKCVSGVERLKTDGGPKRNYTVAEMYKIRQSHKDANELGAESTYKKWKRLGNYAGKFSMFEDGRVRANTLLDITKQPSAEVFCITTESGKTINVTANHKFPTPKGEMPLNQLIIGDELYICGEYEKCTKAYKYSTENKKLLPNHCQICSKDHRRLEVHHVDGNRENNELDNLMRVCPSCHKKEEYKVGRMRKGYPTYTEKIISIESIGIHDVYDLTMEAPAHNFVMENGIVTCNSHAASYGDTSYITAYLKSHFTPVFFLKWLIKSEDKQDKFEEINSLVEDAKLFDIAVMPPDITSTEPAFHIIDKNTIQFGFLNAKGIGEKAVDKLVNFSRSIDRNWDLGRFIIEAIDKIGQKHLRVLTEVGALRSLFKESRAEIIRQIELYGTLTKTEQTKMVKLVREKNLVGKFADIMKEVGVKGKDGICHREDRVPHMQSLFLLQNPLEDTLQYIVDREKELLGIPLSMHYADEVPADAVNVSCLEWVKGRKKEGTIGVEVEDVVFNTIKTGQNVGKQMATLTVSDGTAKMTCKAFSQATEEFERLFRVENLLILSGNRLQDDSFSIRKAWYVK